MTATTAGLFMQVPGPVAPGSDNPAPVAAAPVPQPTGPSAADAAAQIEELKADSEFTKRYLAGDQKARTQFAELHRQAMGGYAPSIDGVMRQMSAKDAEHELMRTARMRNDINPSTEEEVQAFERGTAFQWEKDACDRNIRALIADPDQRAKLLAGDAHLRMMWARWHWIRDTARLEA